MEIETLILKLHEIGAVKFGEFTLKSGQVSPIYIDLRLIVSYPNLLKEISRFMWEKVADLQFDTICGVPYTALPIATAISLEHEIPMLMRRKEAKAYGTKKLIEGKYTPGETCLIIEDLITSGMSIFETIQPIESLGLKVKDIAVLLNREQGGRERVEKQGYHLHSVLTLSELLSTLELHGKIPRTTVEQVQTFIASTC